VLKYESRKEGERQFIETGLVSTNQQVRRSYGMIIELQTMEKMTELTEQHLINDYQRKDLKEKRALAKGTLYDGSKKLKHIIPKGKRV
jgi:hypothetical protein